VKLESGARTRSPTLTCSTPAPTARTRADAFTADHGWKRRADSIDAPCEQEVARVDRRKLNPDKDLIGARSRRLRNVDVLKTLDRIAISCKLNSAHIDISLVRALLTTTVTHSPFLVAMLDTL
jgi:hypothetical protein